MSKIGIIVPVYNVEKYLNYCIESILTQSFTDFELILIDDGSADRSGIICDEYAKLDSRIKVVHKLNGGISSARNFGLSILDSEYVTFVDSDDAIFPEYLQYLYDTAKECEADIVTCEFTSKNEVNIAKDTDYICFSGYEAVIERYSRPDSITATAWCKLYKSHLFNDLSFPEGKIHEDQAVIPIVLYKANTVIKTNRILYYYRIREGSITNTNFSVKRYDNIDNIQYCVDYFKSKRAKRFVRLAKYHKKRTLAEYTIISKF